MNISPGHRIVCKPSCERGVSWNPDPCTITSRYACRDCCVVLCCEPKSIHSHSKTPDPDSKYVANIQERLQIELPKISARLENVSLKPLIKQESSVPEHVDLVKVKLETSFPKNVETTLAKPKNVSLPSLVVSHFFGSLLLKSKLCVCVCVCVCVCLHYKSQPQP